MLPKLCHTLLFPSFQDLIFIFITYHRAGRTSLFPYTSCTFKITISPRRILHITIHSFHTHFSHDSEKCSMNLPSLLLANTPTLRMLILIPTRTHNTSQQTHKQTCFTEYKDYTCYRSKSEINTSRNPISHSLINHNH